MIKKKKFKYAKLLFLIAIVIIACILFNSPAISDPLKNLNKQGSYIAAFIGGIFLAFGFTFPIAIGIILTVQPSNIFLASLIAGAGSVFGDLVILNLIRRVYQKEFNQLENTKIARWIEKTLERGHPHKIKPYLLYVIAGLIIMLPTPDEIGIALLAGFTKIKQSTFSIISLILHALSAFIFFSLPFG